METNGKTLDYLVEYGWFMIDSNENYCGSMDMNVVHCDTLEEALKEQADRLSQLRNELASHPWTGRKWEKAVSRIRPVLVDEDDKEEDAWNVLSDEDKRLLNDIPETSILGKEL